jgi:hypothetical protein
MKKDKETLNTLFDEILEEDTNENILTKINAYNDQLKLAGLMEKRTMKINEINKELKKLFLSPSEKRIRRMIRLIFDLGVILTVLILGHKHLQLNEVHAILLFVFYLTCSVASIQYGVSVWKAYSPRTIIDSLYKLNEELKEIEREIPKTGLDKYKEGKQ